MNTLLHRSIVKWLHWLSAFIILYFFAVEPHLPELGSDAAKTAAMATHAGMGAVLGIVVLLWTGLFALRGPVGKAGPKLQGLARSSYGVLNISLYYALPLMVLTGLATGLAAPFLILGFGLIPLNLEGIGSPQLMAIAEDIHEIAFDGLLILIVAHSGFHLWRHFRLKDNALRLILPSALHRYL